MIYFSSLPWYSKTKIPLAIYLVCPNGLCQHVKAVSDIIYPTLRAISTIQTFGAKYSLLSTRYKWSDYNTKGVQVGPICPTQLVFYTHWWNCILILKSTSPTLNHHCFLNDSPSRICFPQIYPLGTLFSPLCLLVLPCTDRFSVSDKFSFSGTKSSILPVLGVVLFKTTLCIIWVYFNDRCHNVFHDIFPL